MPRSNSKISIVMPVFNGERTIAGAIRSILGQTYENWELIIIDDGSQDKTKEVCSKFTDRRIKYFEQEHGGVAFARNIGNSKASGVYCIVQDADDFSMPDRLEKVVQAFQTTRADVIISDAYINFWDAQYGCMARNYVKAGGNALKNELNGWPAYKRECWIKRPFRLETQFCYDWMMHLDWYLSGFTYHFLHEGLYDYVRYQGSASDRFEKSGQRAESIKKIKEIVKLEYGKDVEAYT